MAQIDDIKSKFSALCTNPEFIQAYNEFNSTNLTQLSLSQLFSTGTLFHLVNIKMANNNELNITDSWYDLSYNGKTYLATGDFEDISTISDEKEINNVGMSVKLTNVRTEYIQLVRSKSFDKSDVQIDLAFMNPNNGRVEQSFNIFTGAVDSLNVVIEYAENLSTNTTEAKMNSVFEVLEKNARAHASDGVHRSYAGNEQDTFFNRIGKWNSQSIWKTVK
ncbi:DUF2163 domain-containing protein [Pantoea ananatis]|uniref:hypothetical protein n=1 Tax=Pantoea ananas TaxID=553 RepID=UPI00352B3467